MLEWEQILQNQKRIKTLGERCFILNKYIFDTVNCGYLKSYIGTMISDVDSCKVEPGIFEAFRSHDGGWRVVKPGNIIQSKDLWSSLFSSVKDDFLRKARATVTYLEKSLNSFIKTSSEGSVSAWKRLALSCRAVLVSFEGDLFGFNKLAVRPTLNVGSLLLERPNSLLCDYIDSDMGAIPVITALESILIDCRAVIEEEDLIVNRRSKTLAVRIMLEKLKTLESAVGKL